MIDNNIISLSMTLSFNPRDWLSYGPFHYPFYLAKDLSRMNHLNCFHWIRAEGGHSNTPSDKYLEFLIAGTPVDISKGRIERYSIHVNQHDVSPNDLQLSHSSQYKFQYPVLNVQVSNNIMAVRTIENTVHITKLDQPEGVSKFKFSEPPRQNSNKTLAWNPQGDTIIAGSHSKTIYLYDLYSEKSRSFTTEYSKEITDAMWIDSKYFATASHGGKILIWSISENKPICGFTDNCSVSSSAPTSLALLKRGTSASDMVILSATGRIATLWDRRNQSKIEFKGDHTSQITKLNCLGVINNEKLFAAMDHNGSIVTYDRNDQTSVYSNPGFGAEDFDCMNGYYGIVGIKRCFAVWMPNLTKRQRASKSISKIKGQCH